MDKSAIEALTNPIHVLHIDQDNDEYNDDWEEDDLQIENITRWYSRQDSDPKPN